MSTSEYDVVIVGAGIHGAGVAQAAVASGHSVLLLEKTDIASATSSRSSKLIHGGLRYLESAQFSLVRESLREREILLKIAPDLVHLIPFYIPIYRDTRRRPWRIRAGLSLYALLAGVSINSWFGALPRNQWDKLDGIKTDGLQAVFRYWDGQTDDAALTRAVTQSALTLGTRLVCPGTFVRAVRDPKGYNIYYLERGTESVCRGNTLVNAAGPWINQVLEKTSPAVPGYPVDLVQGAHILVDNALHQGVYYVEAPWDKRAVFVMPWQGHTLVGTTETVHPDEPTQVQALPDEINYLQNTLEHYFPDHTGELINSFAGLRVLPKQHRRAFHRPRETILCCDDPKTPHMVSIYGGKLTGYRTTAVKVLRLLRHALPERTAAADTAELMLSP
jgi:glycerol-3-phosphate dehydrogenase